MPAFRKIIPTETTKKFVTIEMTEEERHQRYINSLNDFKIQLQAIRNDEKAHYLLIMNTPHDVLRDQLGSDDEEDDEEENFPTTNLSQNMNILSICDIDEDEVDEEEDEVDEDEEDEVDEDEVDEEEDEEDEEEDEEDEEEEDEEEEDDEEGDEEEKYDENYTPTIVSVSVKVF